MESAIDKLNGLIGLQRVKEEIAQLRDFVLIQKARRDQGMEVTDLSYHCVFSGSPGTGKTTVARIVAGIYKELGILKKGHLVEVQRADLVGEYLGQTAPKTNQMIDKALDGILFIDEAYTLSIDNDQYGSECIATLLKRMEDDKDRLVVIIAGYEKEIEHFLSSNPGLKSRFNRFIHFEDYGPKELTSIFLSYLKAKEYIITSGGHQAVFQNIYKAWKQRDQNFGNARFVRNLFEKTIQKQARRLSSLGRTPSRLELQTITESDIE